MKTKIVVLVAFVAAAVAATVIVLSQHRELQALRASHEVRRKFCGFYYGEVSQVRRSLVNEGLWSMSDAELLYRVWSTEPYLELCNVDRKQLEPEASHLGDCEHYQPEHDYTCAARAAAKLFNTIPLKIDP